MKLGVHVEHLIAEGNPLGPTQAVQKGRSVQALQGARQCAQPLDQPLSQSIDIKNIILAFKVSDGENITDYTGQLYPRQFTMSRFSFRY